MGVIYSLLRFSGVTEKEIISDPLLLTRDVATFLSKDVKINVKMDI